MRRCLVQQGFQAAKTMLFLKIFSTFSEMCRLGGLKPSPSKASRSEIFTIASPRKGMETLLLHCQGDLDVLLDDRIAPKGDRNQIPDFLEKSGI
jgi:hypothetical protein